MNATGSARPASALWLNEAAFASVAEAAPVTSAGIATTLVPMGATGIDKNCTALNKKYPHGVGKSGAKDKTSSKPVTNFKKSTKIYKTAMSKNKGLDRDKDGIACEKH